ncbi:hypothetical protein SBRCBS47491_001516 [Sporothrix bragantina]|uniref:Uncharacterized protein n=1 Tax=Sporothrix bragantina TaxID=671064 RepID=A0ABP0AZG5_9PEZI
MADSLHEAGSLLQPPAAQSSSVTGGDVPEGSRRSSASRDLPSQGSSSAGSPLRSPSTVSSHELTTTSTHLQPPTQNLSRIPSDSLPPPKPPRRYGADNSLASSASPSSSSSRQNYELSPSSSPSNPPVPARASLSSSHAAETRAHRTSHRHNRSSGTFLLTNQLGGGGHINGSNGKSAHVRSRTSQRESSGSHKHSNDIGRGSSSRAAHETPEKRSLISSEENTPDSVRSSGSASRYSGTTAPTATSSRTARAQTPEVVASAASSSPSTSSPAASTNQPLDLDSAQIVNMALNLSESRRMASRRKVSQQLPPRLAPVSDSAVGGSLLRQLQQQRRISRTMSPKPERSAGGRVASGQFPQTQGTPRISTSSALQAPFELLSDGSPGGQNPYRYHFSQSTLARAQKAKDYLELLAQQRRVLELIPPLTPGATSRSRATSLGSPPSTSANSGQPQSLFLSGSNNNGELVPGAIRLGRPYNPLQYIRNRKVRVRERRTIDGQAQGFGDVNKTVEWVDEVAKWAATGQGRVPGGYMLPSFASADANAALQSSPPPASRVTGQSALGKPKRPRIDWLIDPADMIADVYWLEQGDNKKLVEDHHWRRVFPQDSALYRPLSQKTDDTFSPFKPGDHGDYPGPFPILTADGDANGSTLKPPMTPAMGPQYKVLENSPEQDQISTRKRARQKLNELRTFHHRHNSSVHAQDVARLRRGSFSDTSDSENDRKRFNRSRAASTTTKEAEKLDKLLSEKLAQESREKDENAAATAAATALKEQTRPSPPSAAVVGVTSANGKKPVSDPSAAQVHTAGTPISSPSKQGQGRASLEIPSVGRRPSIEYDSSRPASPELRPFSKDGLGFVPPLGGDLSPPPSRAASPPRHRFGKVKSIFRDHSRERERERDRDRANQTMLDRGEDYIDPTPTRAKTQQQALQQEQQEHADTVSTPLATIPTAADDVRLASGQDGKGPHSPTRKHKSRPGPGTFDSHRSHSSVSSIAGHLHSNNHSHRHNRSEEGGSTLRGLFKGGPRIDTMLRSGVSKVSDIFWRREDSEPGLADSTAAQMSSSSSDDDSESEAAAPRGRPGKKSSLPSRTPSVAADNSLLQQTSKSGERHYLDVMPTFGRGSDPINRPPSRQSARFERLKPPRIDVRDASPSADDAANDQKQLGLQLSSSRRNSSLQPLYRRPQQDSDYSESDTRSRRSSRVSGVASSINGSLGSGSLQHLSRQFGSMSSAAGRSASRPRWSISQPAFKNRGSVSRRELARLHASMYSSAVLAKELLRKANEPKLLAPRWNDDDASNGSAKKRRSSNVADNDDADDEGGHDEDAEASPKGGAGSGPIIVRGANGETSLTWADIAAYAPNPAELARRPIKQVEIYPLAAQVLGSAIQRSGVSWQRSAETFANTTVPQLRQRIEGVRTRVAVELSDMARQAADEADEVTRDLMAVQRLQVKRVEDSIEKMLRRRRRRFRWVRRAGWLTVEWLLVGFMWYVWFVVMLARIVLGFGRGVYTGVRWLLWL